MQLSVKAKLHTLFVVLMLVFMVLSTCISYFVSKRLIIDNVQLSNESELMLSMHTMQDLVHKSKENLQLFVDDYKLAFKELGTEDAALLNHESEINSEFLTFLYTNQEFTGMYLYQGTMLIGTSIRTQLITHVASVSSKPDEASMKHDLMELLIQNGLFERDKLHEENLVIAKTVEGAYMVAVLDYEKLEQLKNIKLVQLGERLQVIAGYDQIEPRALAQIANSASDSGTVMTRRWNDQVISSYRNDKGDWYVLLRDISGINQQFYRIIRNVGIVAILIVSGFVLLSGMLANKLITPIYEFIHTLRKVKGQEDEQLMQRFISSYKGYSSVSGQFFKYYLLLFIPVFVTILISYISFDRMVEQSTEQGYSSLFNKTANSIDNRLQSHISYMRYLSLDSEFQSLMVQANASQPEAGAAAAFSDLLVRKGVIHKNVSYIAVYNAKNKLVYANTNRLDPARQSSSDVGGRSLEGELTIVNDDDSDLLPPQVVSRQEVLYLSQTSDRENEFRYLGYIEMGIQNMFEGLPANGPNAQYDMYLVDSQRRVYPISSSFGTQFAAELLEEVLTKPGSDMENVSYRGENALASYFAINGGKWQLGFFVPTNWEKQKYIFILLYAAEMVCMLLIIVAASTFLGRRMTAPIRRAIGVLGAYPQDLTARLDGREREYEFVVLAKNFNAMLTRLEEMTHQLRAKESENDALDRRINKLLLRALQSQINPHFLQNIFTSIIFLLKTNRNDKASEMLVATAKFLKSGLYGTRDLVSLEEELEHVRSYLDIQSIRYEAQLQAHIDIGARLLQIKTPKFVLQPLVENAIHHAMEKDRLLTIRIHGSEEEDGSLLIVVEDDGRGMPPEQVRVILHNLHHRSQSAHYGLSNVHERIHLEFGERYGLAVRSASQQGTAVSVKLPIHYEEEG